MGTFRAGFWSRMEDALSTLKARGYNIIIEWCPSHGKQKEWRPKTALLSASHARHLNQLAAVACTKVMETSFPSRASTENQCAEKSANLWTKKCLGLARDVAQRLIEHVENVRRGAGLAFLFDDEDDDDDKHDKNNDNDHNDNKIGQHDTTDNSTQRPKNKADEHDNTGNDTKRLKTSSAAKMESSVGTKTISKRMRAHNHNEGDDRAKRARQGEG